MKLLGLAPTQIFSGFETSFFDAIRDQGTDVEYFPVESPLFKLLCTLSSFYPDRKKWGTRRDRHYHASIAAFKRKSSRARSIVSEQQDRFDAIYQVGGLWNPLSDGTPLPLFLHVDYTSQLSRKRNSEWKRKPGRAEQFWFEQEQKLYEQARLVLTTTENARRSILDDYGISGDHVVTVGAGVSAPYDRLEPDRLPRYDSQKILFVGKGFVGKGLDTVLESFAAVREQLPKATLTIVGPTGPPITGDGINYMGRIPDRERVRELYFDHALFVMPSRFEPLGQVFLEAMSCHLPCIGSTVDAMPEMIEEDRTGFLIEPGDSATLTTRIVQVLSDPPLAAQLGQAGYERLCQHHTWSIVGDRIVANIERAI